MSLLSAVNLKFGFADGVLFQDAAFKVEEGSKIGLIGVNGCGKTSLFKLITGEYTPVDGFISKNSKLRIGYMEQYLECDDSKTLYDETLTVFDDVKELEMRLESINKLLNDSADISLIEEQDSLTSEIERRDGLVYKAKTRSALLGIGFSEKDLDLSVGALSGGQRSKLSLCKLLLSNANLLLLDEPTNNLDIDAVNWLEDFLAKYKGALIVVSHDRFFLDKVTSYTFEIAYNKLYSAPGNYSRYQKLKAERELSVEREYEKNMTEIKRIEGIIEQQKRFNQERNYITIESKQKQIDRIKSSLVVPEKALKSVRFSFKTNLRAGDDVLSVRSLSKSFGEKKLFKDFDLEIKRGEKVFLIGPNGCGKSTFLKIINREESSDDGFFSLGTNVRIGYFDQNIEKLRSDKTVINEVWDDYRLMDQTEIRNALARFLFRGDDVFKIVSSLSGGEKSKISLLKIMLSKPNFLILDEPTNHLDIASREVLEDALLDYDGTLLVVSHDRYFINKLASRIVYLNHDGAVLIDGNYDKYLEIKEQLNRPDAPVVEAKEKTLNSYQLEKLNKSLERKRRADIKKTEEMISAYEEEISTVQAELSSDEIQSDYDRLLELTEALTQKQEKLDSLYAEWEKLQTEE